MENRICPQCRATYPIEAPPGLCPRCLLKAGLYDSGERSLESVAPTTPNVAKQAFAPPTVDELGGCFPQLEILELVGVGGMGAVYKVRQRRLDRLAALKIIRPDNSNDASFAARFNREAKTLARLSHAHIVSIYDFGDAELAAPGIVSRKLYYFLMEYVAGSNLRQSMQNGLFRPNQALAIVPQICDALQYAHDVGIVHRDIKPENILLDKKGNIKIADFGLAKLTAGDPEDLRLTGTHQVVGTPRYMAPEQMQGLQAVDHRADIFSLGVVFYEMLTGQVPVGHFEAPSKRVQVDVRLDEIVLRSLASAPERRYQHACEIKTDVQSLTCNQLDSVSNSVAQSLSAYPTQNAEIDDADERKRSAELAEIAPDWLQFPIAALFALAWVVIAVLWNFKWLGLAMGVAAMTAAAYGIHLWLLAYRPQLKRELDREGKWTRAARRLVAAFLFSLGVVALVWFQVAVGDAITTASLTDSIDKNQELEFIHRAGHGDLVAQDVHGISSFIIFQLPTIFMAALLALSLLLSGAMTLFETRRYRYMWKHSWAPSISIAAWCVAMLIVVHFVHLTMLGYSSASTPSKEFTCNNDFENTKRKLEVWMQDHAYAVSNMQHASLWKSNSQIGQVYTLLTAPSSWFDRFQVSWRYPVLRPLPTIQFRMVTQPNQSIFVELQLPMNLKGSPEEAWWLAQADELRTRLCDESK